MIANKHPLETPNISLKDWKQAIMDTLKKSLIDYVIHVLMVKASHKVLSFLLNNVLLITTIDFCIDFFIFNF